MDRLDAIRATHHRLAQAGRLSALGIVRSEPQDPVLLLRLQRRLERLLAGTVPASEVLAAASQAARPVPASIPVPASDPVRLTEQPEAWRAVEDEATAVEARLTESAALAEAAALLDEREAELAEIQAETARLIEAAPAVRAEQAPRSEQAARRRQSSTPRPRAREPRTKPKASPGRKAPKRIYKTPRHHQELTLDVVTEILRGQPVGVIGMKKLAHLLRLRGCQLFEPAELALELLRLGLPPTRTGGSPSIDSNSPAVRRHIRSA